jgi:glycosyltransferase involved in cell wall biosynthesis
MHVVIATHGFLPNVGGVSTNVATLARGFVSAGHRVTVVSLSPGPTDGYGHEVVRRPGPARLFQLYRQADLLILSNLAIKLIYPLAFLRRPFALRHHSESAFRLSNSPFSVDVLRRAVVKRATHFMTSAYVGRKSGYPRYEVTHPFANPLHITEEVKKPAGARSGLLFAGRLEPEKGVLWLLDHWPRIRERLGVDELRLAGNGSLAEAVQARIDGGLDRVRYLGRLSLSDTAKAMGGAAYVIVPSLWEEPFGAVALEALAAGALVLLSDRGGLPETTGELGYTFDPDDEASLDGALDRARATRARQLADPAVRAAYEQAVSAHLANFQPNIVVGKILAAMGFGGG